MTVRVNVWPEFHSEIQHPRKYQYLARNVLQYQSFQYRQSRPVAVVVHRADIPARGFFLHDGLLVLVYWRVHLLPIHQRRANHLIPYRSYHQIYRQREVQS